jgi:hypothetical protein
MSRFRSRSVLVFLAVSVLFALAGRQLALACNDGANPQELAVQGLYGCWRDLYLAVWNLYDLHDDSWNPAGKSDACNANLPFAKVVNAVFTIHYILTDNYIPQWHSIEDYTTSSEAGSSRFHGQFYTRFIEYSGSAEADSDTGRTFGKDRVNLHCPLFNLNGPSDDPVNRGSVMIHESWHHWQQAHGFDTSHMDGPIGSCSNGAGSCDWYYFHGTGDFDFGQLDRYDTNPNHLRFHSPYQIAVEFDSDVSELSQSWVPVSVTQKARYYGNTRLGNTFRNFIAYRIGDPRPF